MDCLSCSGPLHRMVPSTCSLRFFLYILVVFLHWASSCKHFQHRHQFTHRVFSMFQSNSNCTQWPFGQKMSSRLFAAISPKTVLRKFINSLLADRFKRAGTYRSKGNETNFKMAIWKSVFMNSRYKYHFEASIIDILMATERPSFWLIRLFQTARTWRD